jgi:hypothetical protein
MLETFYAHPKNSPPLCKPFLNPFFSCNSQLHDSVIHFRGKFVQNRESFDSGGDPYV